MSIKLSLNFCINMLVESPLAQHNNIFIFLPHLFIQLFCLIQYILIELKTNQSDVH